MKKIITKIAYIAIFFGLFILGCTKDVDIQDTFDYDVNVVVKDSGYVFEAADLNLKITPKRVVKGTTYKVSYAITSGGAYLEVGKPTTTIKKDDNYKMPDTREETFKFYPTTVGINKIIVTIEDSNGLKKQKEIIYKAKLAPFTFILTPNLNTYTINSRGAITSTLIRNLEDSFTFSYLVENGTGILYNGSEAIPLGKPYKVIGGVSQLHYVPTTLGTHKLTATVTASDGAKITRTIEILVDNVPFSLNATSVSTSINVNQEVIMNVDLTELQKGISSTYEITHSFDSKGIAGTLKNSSGNIVNPGVFSAIAPGSYQFKYKASTQGTCYLTFKVKDSNGQTKETTVVITVTNVPFTFTGTSTEKTILLNEVSKLNFNIVPNTTDSAGVNYTFVFQAEAGDGILTDLDGKIIQRGAPITVNKGVFSLNYKPTSLGSHILNCTVTDNNGESRTVKIEMESIHTPVTFNVSSVTQTYVNQGVGVDFVITPQLKSNLTYEMNYYVSGGQGILTNGGVEIKTGEYFSVVKGGFKYNFTPTIAGNFVLTFELKDSNGQIVSKSVSIVVANNKFTFTPTPSQKVFVNESNVFSYALVPTGNYANTVYNVSYTLEAGQLGTFSNNGVEVQQGIPITVKPSSFNLSYKPTTVGEHKIHYIVTDSNGLKEEVVQTVVVVAANFNFKVQQANTTVYKNNTDVILASISQEQINANIGYSMTYTLTGVGAIYKDGVALPNFFAITPGNHTYTFVSAQSGNTEIVFNVVDTNGIAHSQTIKYTTINADFSVTSSGDGTLNLGKSKDFNVYLSQLTSDPTATYQVRYLFESGSVGNGKIYNGATEIPLGTFQNINLGTTSLKILGTGVGIINLKVEIKDNNGVIHTSVIALEVLAINFSFTGGSQQNTIYVNGSTPINFDVTESSNSETAYEMKYVITEGNAQINNGANPQNSNTWYPVAKGSYNRTFLGTTVGDIKITFTVRNTTTLVEKTQNIVISVLATDFNFSAVATNNNQTTKTPVNVNFNVDQIGGGYALYSMTFVSSGTGTLNYGGNTYTSGQTIPIMAGASNGTYTGTTSGTHDVIFKIVNRYNLQKTSTAKITYVANDFALTTSGDGSLNVNTSKIINAFISQDNTDPNINYQVKYTIESGSTGNGNLSLNGTSISYGTYQNINVGATAINFNATESGSVNLIVTVKDSNGLIHSSTISLNVQAINFNFTGAAQQNTIYVNGSTPLNFDITESASSGTQYEMKYVITEGIGQIKNGSNIENSNTWYPVSIGSFNRDFNGTTIGNVKITFTVRNKTTLVEKTQNFVFTVNPSEFTFNAVRTLTGQVVNTAIPVVLNLTQTGGNGDTYVMTFSSSSNGTFIYDGVSYSPGQNITVKTGSSTGEYIGTSVGNHNITFTVKNQLNLAKTSDVSLNYIINDFTLSSSGDGSMYINQNRDFNAFIAQLLPDNTINYQIKFSFDSGTSGGGEITKSGSSVPLGIYQNVALGSSTYNFKGLTPGFINLLIEVKNNNGLLKSSIVMFEVKSADFTFLGGAVNNTCYIDDSVVLNFDLSESITSGTDYEISYSINQGSSSVRDGSSILYPYQWYPVSTGNFQRTLSVTSQGSNNLTFTLRNKVTLQTKTVNINVNGYQKPTPINVYTSLDYFDRGWPNHDNWRWYMYMEFMKDSSATISSVVLTIGGENFTLSPTAVQVASHGQDFRYIEDDRSRREDYDLQPYTIKVTDSNGVVYIYSDIWLNHIF